MLFVTLAQVRYQADNFLLSTRRHKMTVPEQDAPNYSSIGVGGTSTFFEKCSLTNPTLYYFPYNGFVFLVSYF